MLRYDLMSIRRLRRSRSWCFFFQAEDGIRDLVRSRGLGDVYKRQVRTLVDDAIAAAVAFLTGGTPEETTTYDNGAFEAVSYTHLTLPTSDLV